MSYIARPLLSFLLHCDGTESNNAPVQKSGLTVRGSGLGTNRLLFGANTTTRLFVFDTFLRSHIFHINFYYTHNNS